MVNVQSNVTAGKFPFYPVSIKTRTLKSDHSLEAIQYDSSGLVCINSVEGSEAIRECIRQNPFYLLFENSDFEI